MVNETGFSGTMTFFRAVSAALLLSVYIYVAAVQYWLPVATPVRTEQHATGLEIPSIGIGTWLSDRDAVAHAVEFALKSGYNHVDAALIYENEDQTGKGIRAANLPRDKLWVTSKLWNPHHRLPEAAAAIQKSIKDLGVGYLDLYLIHWPVAFVPGEGTKVDEDTTIVDTWRVMENLARANLTRKIGISNFSKKDVETIMKICEICPYAHEFETHPYLQQQEFVDYHKEIGVKVIAYSPLANTNPTYKDKNTLEPILKDPFWADLAAKKNATIAQAVLAWGRQRDTIIIPKSIHEKYIAENLGALDISFTDSEMRDIADQDKKTRMNNPGKKWGIKLFADLDDPTRLDDKDDEGEDEL
ncbi:aldo/keto reductase [Nemania sp. FL0916]|nr:aldo/keto reductase [Nemania sp. FL0916]